MIAVNMQINVCLAPSLSWAISSNSVPVSITNTDSSTSGTSSSVMVMLIC